MKIVVDENIPFVEAAFEPLGQVVKLPGRSIKPNDLQDCDVLLVRSVTQVNSQLLHNSPVRFVGTATSGIDHIDTDYLTTKNIGFTDAKGCNAWSVAEYVMSAIAFWSLTRHLSLNQISVGIIGYGHVGKKVKQLCDIFDMPNLIFDPPLNEKGYPFESVNLSDIFQCDVITLHVPLNKTGNHPTVDLISQYEVNGLNDKQLLINTSRGEVIDEAALLARSNDLNLVLDVWHNEPNINILLLKDTVLGTPHIAGYSFEGKVRGTQKLYNECCHYFDIKPNYKAFQAILPSRMNNTKTISKTPQDILKKYNIRIDNDRLKQVLQNPELNGGNHFDFLRKNYPTRNEWHPTIPG